MDRESAAGLIAAQLTCCAVQGVQIAPPVEMALHQAVSPLETRLAQILTVWRGLRREVLAELRNGEAAPVAAVGVPSASPLPNDGWPVTTTPVDRLWDGKPIMQITEDEDTDSTSGFASPSH